MKMNFRECFCAFSGLILCLFQFSLSQELAPPVTTLNVTEWCEDYNYKVDLEDHLSNAILTVQEHWSLDCEILLGKGLDKFIVISFYEYDLDKDDKLVFKDSQGTELSMKGRGMHSFGEKSFIFKSPVSIHYATNDRSYYKETAKFKFLFTLSHDFTCKKDEFLCTNWQCISKNLVCDKQNNCGDGSDEIDCKPVCTENEFKCANKKCIPKYKLCNVLDDCGDGSDEENCHKNCEGLQQFKCSNSRCISNLQVCNDKNDCGDWSDETNCYSPCDFNKFRCNNKKCIDSWKVCNKRDDCGDRTDEKNCRRCYSYEFQCSNGNCISKDLVCNNRNDCGDNSEERDCNSADRRKVTVVELRNPWLITIIVCAAVLAIVVVAFAAIVIRNRIKRKQKPPTTPHSNVSTSTNAQNVQPPNQFGRGRPSERSSIQHPGHIQPPTAVSGEQAFQASSMYPQLQSGVENSDVHHVQPRNFLERVRQSFRSGRQPETSSMQSPGHTEHSSVASGAQTYQVPSMYPHLQSGIDNPEFRIEE